MPVKVEENHIPVTRTKFHAHVEETIEQGGRLAEGSMLGDVPVSEEEYPGKTHLWETIERTRENIGRSVDGYVESAVKAGDPSDGVDYTGYVEFGTSKMAAQPFVGPGYEVGKAYVLDRLKRSIR